MAQSEQEDVRQSWSSVHYLGAFGYMKMVVIFAMTNRIPVPAAPGYTMVRTCAPESTLPCSRQDSAGNEDVSLLWARRTRSVLRK